MLTDPICCWDQNGFPVLLIDLQRDGTGVIMRECVTIKLSREDLSRLQYVKPVELEPPPKVITKRGDDDGQTLLRYTLRNNPNTLHLMAAELGMPASVADEVLAELFQGQEIPRPVERRRRGPKPRQPAQLQAQEPAPVDRPSLLQRAAVDRQGADPPEQRATALRSEATRNADLRRRLKGVRSHDLSQHPCPWVREGVAYLKQLQARP